MKRSENYRSNEAKLTLYEMISATYLHRTNRCVHLTIHHPFNRKTPQPGEWLTFYHTSERWNSSTGVLRLREGKETHPTRHEDYCNPTNEIRATVGVKAQSVVTSRKTSMKMQKVVHIRSIKRNEILSYLRRRAW